MKRERRMEDKGSYPGPVFEKELVPSVHRALTAKSSEHK